MSKQFARKLHKKFAFETPETIRSFSPSIILRQPEDPDFFLYTPDTTARARDWAIENDYAQVVGAQSCAHALWVAACPARGCQGYGFDHTNVWLEKRGYGRPFILTQPYLKAIPEKMKAYAKAHGLDLKSYTTMDAWYGHGTLPMRLSYESSGACWLEVQAHDYLYNNIK